MACNIIGMLDERLQFPEIVVTYLRVVYVSPESRKVPRCLHTDKIGETTRDENASTKMFKVMADDIRSDLASATLWAANQRGQIGDPVSAETCPGRFERRPNQTSPTIQVPCRHAARQRMIFLGQFLYSLRLIIGLTDSGS